MFEIKQDQITKWGRVKPNNNELLAPNSVDVQCPNYECRRSLVNLPIQWIVTNYRFIYARNTCAGCGESTWLILFDPPRNDSKEAIESSKLFIYPSPPVQPVLPEGIEIVSPDFVKIYTQAITAEKLGLDELDGIGNRKAIEFLIKDYLCSKFPNKIEEIKSKFLGACIKEYVEDPKIKDCAEMAVWLANDETHYERRWEDKDVSDLKLLLQLTLYWISSEYLTEKYKSDMDRN